MIVHRILALVLALCSGQALAQLNTTTAQLLVENLLSTQNPLLVVEEIAHNGLTVEPVGNGYAVSVAQPHLPGRPAFFPDMEFTLTPRTQDLIDVKVTKIPTTANISDGGHVTFTPTVFRGLYSQTARGFETLELSFVDFTYNHREVQFSIDQFDVEMRTRDQVSQLSFLVEGYTADIQDVIDVQESVGNLELTLSLPSNQSQAGDVLHLANLFFDTIVRAGREDTNLIRQARPLPSDLQGLTFEFSLSDWVPQWMALRDETMREVMAATHIPRLSIRGDVVPLAPTQSDLVFEMEVDGFDVRFPENETLTSTIGGMRFAFAFRGIQTSLIGDLISQEEGMQSTATGLLLGSFGGVHVSAEIENLEAVSAAENAHLVLDQAGFELDITSPYAGAPNTKDVRLNLSLSRLDAAYPSVLEALDPAWSILLEPALPNILDLRLDVRAVPGDIWRGLVGLVADIQDMPGDTASVAEVLSLTLDGTRYVSDLFTANMGGTLSLAPDAPLFSVGDLRLEISELRALIAAMQRSARIPDKTVAQFLTLGSVGLATIAGFAEQSPDGTALFNFEFQQDGLPTINGRSLPVSF